MIIYRVETPDGGGPYNGPRGMSPMEMFALSNNRRRQPAPGDDIPGYNGNHSYENRFGFASIDQAKNWFDWRVYHLLEDRGFCLARYLVPDEQVWCGGHQCAFNYTEAKKIGYDPIEVIRS